MPETLLLSPPAARALIFGALTGAGTAPANAGYFTEAILDTELSGLEGHGFYWLQFYCAHVKSGKVKGKVRPTVRQLTPAAFQADARDGFAHPAIEKGFEKLVPAARSLGIAALAVKNSYNAATLGFHTGTLAKQGLLSLGFTNARPMIAPPGGSRPAIGTNPLSFAVPGKAGKLAFLIEQSSSAVAWTAVKRAAEQGLAIPLGWALDAAGQPTTDPVAGLAGSMAPAGGYKGFGQGLIVETLCAALAGGHLGPAIGSMMADDGVPVRCGQFFLAIEPKIFAGGLFGRKITELTGSILDQEGARLPNSRREASIRRRLREGLPIEAGLHATLQAFARGERPAAAPGQPAATSARTV